MDLVISTRHGEISDRQKREVQEQFERLGRYEPRISRVSVTLTDEGDRWEVEAHASVDRGDAVHAHGEGGDPRSAVDAAADRLGRQLRRQRDRHTDHQAPGAGSTPPGAGDRG
jgi:ribosomal subunit interface protein